MLYKKISSSHPFRSTTVFYAILWLIIPSIILILTWYIAKPLILDALVLSFISEDTIKNFSGNPSMLVDRVKSINIERPFPGTDKNLIEAAVYLKQTLEEFKPLLF